MEQPIRFKEFTISYVMTKL